MSGQANSGIWFSSFQTTAVVFLIQQRPYHLPQVAPVQHTLHRIAATTLDFVLSFWPPLLGPFCPPPASFLQWGGMSSLTPLQGSPSAPQQGLLGPLAYNQSSGI